MMLLLLLLLLLLRMMLLLTRGVRGKRGGGRRRRGGGQTCPCRHASSAVRAHWPVSTPPRCTSAIGKRGGRGEQTCGLLVLGAISNSCFRLRGETTTTTTMRGVWGRRTLSKGRMSSYNSSSRPASSSAPVASSAGTKPGATAERKAVTSTTEGFSGPPKEAAAMREMIISGFLSAYNMTNWSADAESALGIPSVGSDASGTVIVASAAPTLPAAAVRQRRRRRRRGRKGRRERRGGGDVGRACGMTEGGRGESGGEGGPNGQQTARLARLAPKHPFF